MRRFEIGDITPGAIGTAIPYDAADLSQAAEKAADVTMAEPEDTGRPTVVEPSNLDPALPPDWGARIRELPGNTLVHIPATCRNRMATAATEVWEGMAKRTPGWTRLGEGFFKLMLASMPQGARIPKEVATSAGALADKAA